MIVDIRLLSLEVAVEACSKTVGVRVGQNLMVTASNTSLRMCGGPPCLGEPQRRPGTGDSYHNNSYNQI